MNLTRAAIRLILCPFQSRLLPVHIGYGVQTPMPLKLRAFLDFAAPRLRRRSLNATDQFSLASASSGQSTSANDCPCKSILSPFKPWSLISPPIAFRLSSRINDIRPRRKPKNSDDIIMDC
jgi:hypothetical protein